MLVSFIYGFDECGWELTLELVALKDSTNNMRVAHVINPIYYVFLLADVN